MSKGGNNSGEPNDSDAKRDYFTLFPPAKKEVTGKREKKKSKREYEIHTTQGKREAIFSNLPTKYIIDW